MSNSPNDLHASGVRAASDTALAKERLHQSGCPHLSEHGLAERWRLSVRTLQRWRADGTGPTFLRLGHHIAYRLSDVERFEAAHAQAGDRS